MNDNQPNEPASPLAYHSGGDLAGFTLLRVLLLSISLVMAGTMLSHFAGGIDSVAMSSGFRWYSISTVAEKFTILLHASGALTLVFCLLALRNSRASSLSGVIWCGWFNVAIAIAASGMAYVHDWQERSIAAVNQSLLFVGVLGSWLGQICIEDVPIAALLYALTCPLVQRSTQA